jgi:hypothetical protein
VFDDPAFTLVPLHEEGLDFTVGLVWGRDRAAAEPDVAALAESMRGTWRDGPDLI